MMAGRAPPTFNKARADDDVSPLMLHALNHGHNVFGHVLAVSIKLNDGIITMLKRITASSLESAREPKVDGVAHVVEATAFADCLSLVRGAVINNEVVAFRHDGRELVHRSLNAPLFVVCGDYCKYPQVGFRPTAR